MEDHQLSLDINQIYASSLQGEEQGGSYSDAACGGYEAGAPTTTTTTTTTRADAPCTPPEVALDRSTDGDKENRHAMGRRGPNM